MWIIRPTGKGRYRLALVVDRPIHPNANLAITKVPDATPGIIAKYAFGDEQALLARVRYNRLVDVFTGVTCYSLQNHLRTTVPEMGQVETDELYVGLDKKGAHYMFPVQAKGGNDKLSVVQIEQDFAVCANKFPALICRPIAAQFMDGGIIALFEFEQADGSVRISAERHYKLVPPEEVTKVDLENYQKRTADRDDPLSARNYYPRPQKLRIQRYFFQWHIEFLRRLGKNKNENKKIKRIQRPAEEAGNDGIPCVSARQRF